MRRELNFRKSLDYLIKSIDQKTGGSRAYFSRILFPELLELEGQQGGKEIVKNHTVDWVNWDDQKLLMDIDTIEDYLDIQNYL